MKPFTYSDYIYYILKLRNNPPYILMLNDKKSEYRIGKNNLYQPHDKIFKEILDDKIEAVDFLNKNLKIKNTQYALKSMDIEKYNRKFITQEFSNMESDIVYKKVDEDIFFLIEHQSKIDYSMPYRILKYNMAIIDSAIDRTKINKKNYKIPAVYSFVIYTGNQTWNAEKYIIDKQERLKGVNNKLFANFKVIDINKYSEKQLLESNNLLSKVMLLEKCRSINQIEEKLTEILNNDLDKRQIIFIGRVINYILNDKVDIQTFNDILYSKLGGKSEMNFIEILRDYFHEDIEKREKGKKELEDVKKEIEDGKKELEDGKKELEDGKKELEDGKKELEDGKKELEDGKKELEENNKKIKEKNIEIKKKEENIKEKINRIILGMINNKVDDKKIMEMMEIDENELLKIKRENHIIA